MRQFLALLLVVMTAWPAAAQQAPVRPDTLRPAHADTVQAIHRLYQGRRGRGLALSMGGVGGAVLGTMVWNQLDPPYRVAGSIAPDLSGVAHGMFASLAALGPILVGSVFLEAFGKRQEQTLLRRYEAGEPLPPRIRQRLKPRYFVP